MDEASRTVAAGHNHAGKQEDGVRTPVLRHR